MNVYLAPMDRDQIAGEIERYIFEDLSDDECARIERLVMEDPLYAQELELLSTLVDVPEDIAELEAPGQAARERCDVAIPLSCFAK